MKPSWTMFFFSTTLTFSSLFHQNLQAANSCSKIDFDKLTWSDKLSTYDVKAFSIGLNISGSFEGNDSWANLTNNFDGMGLSMGLLNQTLGTSSLQPLLIQMRDQHPKEMAALVGAPRLKSMLEMLKSWEGKSLQATEEEVFFSPLDETETLVDIMTTPELKTFYDIMDRSSQSVSWAVNNLYNGSKFKPDWEKDLKALSNSMPYRNIQLNAATKNHNAAMKWFTQFKFTQLRSYLLMMDFVVQNGGFYKENIDAYNSFLNNNPRATEQQKLEKIVEIRLTRVRPKYREDVRKRKMSIVNGTGRVHGANRDFPKEYCYTHLESYDLKRMILETFSSANHE